MAKTKKRDPLQVQISVTLRMPRVRGKLVKPTARLINEAIAYRIRHGHDHPSAKTRIIRWRNPARRGPGARWRQGNQSDAWASLANPLGQAIVDVVPDWPDENDDE